jgi:hypothetical protein
MPALSTRDPAGQSRQTAAQSCPAERVLPHVGQSDWALATASEGLRKAAKV